MSDYPNIDSDSAGYQNRVVDQHRRINSQQKCLPTGVLVVFLLALFNPLSAVHAASSVDTSQMVAAHTASLQATRLQDSRTQEKSATPVALDLTSDDLATPAFSVRDNLLNIVFFLLVTIAAIMGLAWLVHKTRLLRLSGQGRQLLKVRHMLPIGVKQKIAVLQVGQQQILVGITSQQINHLMTLTEPLESPEQDEGFQKVLRRILTKDSDSGFLD